MKTLLAILLILPIACLADEPVIFVLDSENDSYTVPENQVLVIDSINNNITSHTAVLAITIDGKLIPWTVSFGAGDSVPSYNPHQTLPRPVKIPGGAVLTVLDFSGFSGDATFAFFGSLEKRPGFSWWWHR